MTIRGEPAFGRGSSRHNLVSGGSKDPNHDAVMRIGSEAPKRRTHSFSRHDSQGRPGPRHLEPSSATRHKRTDGPKLSGAFNILRLLCRTQNDALRNHALPHEPPQGDQKLARQGGHADPQVGHWQTKDGGRRLIAWSNKPMAGPGGAPVSLITTGIDLTDRAPHREDDERALEGDPEAKLAEVSGSPPSSARCGAWPPWSPPRSAPSACSRRSRGVRARAAGQRLRVLRYEGDGTATIVGRHNRDSVDVFRVGESPAGRRRARPSRACCATGAPARIDDWGGRDRRDRRGDLPRRLPLLRRRADRRRRRAVGRGRDRERGPAAAGHRGPARRVLRARLARRRQRPGARGPDRLARPPGQGRRRAAPPARTQPPRRRPAAPRLRRAEAARGARAARGRPEVTARLLDEALRELGAGLEELREIARGLHPGDPRRARARPRAGGRSPSACRSRSSSTSPDERLPEHLEATAYYIVSEALTNVAKHAEAAARARHGRAATATSCAARSPTTAAAAPTLARQRHRSACATAPRRPAGRSRSSARRGADRRHRPRCR